MKLISWTQNTCLIWESHHPYEANYAYHIDTADFRLLRAILTYYMRQERFQDGLWLVAVQNGSFSKVLHRLMTLLC